LAFGNEKPMDKIESQGVKGGDFLNDFFKKYYLILYFSKRLLPNNFLSSWRWSFFCFLFLRKKKGFVFLQVVIFHLLQLNAEWF